MRLARLLGYDFVKRAFDVVASISMLLLLAPLLLCLSILVGAALGRPVVFAQRRPGVHGRLFTLYKFRTMRNVNVDSGLLTNEDRMTSLGRFLRSTSLDELPSLWNVARGDMSFVGPRPLRVSYLQRYSTEQRVRHSVRPGLTGLAQVRGRNTLDWEKRIALDIEYVKRRSPALDLAILRDTIKIVFRREGISADGQATMSEFLGPVTTSRVRLEPLSESHLPQRVEWLNHPAVRNGISISFTADIESMAAWHRGIASDCRRDDWVGVDPRDERVVSMCGIRRNDEGGASLYIYVDPERHGRGYGTDTMTLLIARARERDVRYLNLETPSQNGSAIGLYHKLGFVDLGPADGGEKRRMRLDTSTGHRDG